MNTQHRSLRQSSHGFSALEALLILVVVAVLAGAGWYIWQRERKTTSNTNNSSPQSNNKGSSTPTPKPDPYAGWKVYGNSEAGLTFKYPAVWTESTNDTLRYQDGSFGGVSGTVASPSGNNLHWTYQVEGGKGDAGCIPNSGDAPFAAGDKCESKQIISIEQLPSVKPPTGKSFRNLFGDSLYITETKLSGGYINAVTGKTVDTGPTYQICLDPYYNSGNGSPVAPPKVGSTMGFELPCEYWDTGFNAMFPVNGAAGFDSADAQTAKLIMRSFNAL